MIVTGESNLSEVLKSLSSHIDDSIYSDMFEDSFLLKNSTSKTLEFILIKPIIVYTKKKSLISNNMKFIVLSP